MTVPTVPYYPVTHDDGVNIATALTDIANAKRNMPLMLTDAFDTTKNYAVGDYAIYSNRLYRFTSAHSAGPWNSTHAIQVLLSDELHPDFKVSGTVSSGNYILTDSRIDDDHWEVASIYIENPERVGSKIHWVMDISAHTVSLSATYSASTNVVVKMHWVQ